MSHRLGLVVGGALLSLSCRSATRELPATPTASAVTSAPAPPTSSAAVVASAAPPPAPCLPRQARSGSFVHVEARGTSALVCYDAGERDAACVEVDPSTGAQRPASSWRGPPDEVPESGAFTATAEHRVVSVCPRAGEAACKRVTLGSDPLGVAVDDAGTKLFAFVAEVRDAGAVPWLLFGELWDVATGRRLAHRQLSSTMAYTSDENVYFASFVGGAWLLRDEIPERSAGIMGLWDGNLGRAGTWLGPGAFVKLDGTTWANATTDQVTFVDVARVTEAGKALTIPEHRPATQPGRAGLLVQGERVLWATATPPAIVTFDRKTHVLGETHALKLCD